MPKGSFSTIQLSSQFLESVFSVFQKEKDRFYDGYLRKLISKIFKLRYPPTCKILEITFVAQDHIVFFRHSKQFVWKWYSVKNVFAILYRQI